MERAIIEDESQAFGELGANRIRPDRRDRRHALPFTELSDDEFEIFCFLLLKRENPNDRIRLLGKTADRGRDITWLKANGDYVLIQCKRYSLSVGLPQIRAELAKLVTNIFRRTITAPTCVHFYLVPDITNQAQDLLDDQTAWRKEAADAIKKHLGGEAPLELLSYAEKWWPIFDVDRAISLTERAKSFPDLIDEFFGVQKVVDASLASEVRRELSRFGGLLEASLSPKLEPPREMLLDVESLIASFQRESASLLSWPTTLKNDRWIERPEFAELDRRLKSEESETILLLGAPGSGKSAILARLGLSLSAAGYAVLAIKGDKLDPRIDSAGKLAETLHLPALLPECVTSVAKVKQVVVLLDQLDALADLVDLKSERLNVLLDLVRRLDGISNVRVICSCRDFESQYDSRLAAIDALAVQLALPSWEQVTNELHLLGVESHDWPEPLRDLLRVPQQLKVFLERFRGTSEDLVFTSYQHMLEDLWEQRVLKHHDRERRANLLLDIASAMAERESLWLPFALFEHESPLIDALQAEGILVRPNRGVKIGFQHQTVFEHIRARTFARGKESLAEFVLNRQSSLFVRPALWAALRYLRDADSQAYRTEITKLWSAAIRAHVRFLLIDFLGQVTEPRDYEQTMLVEAIQDGNTSARALMSIRGSQGWFMSLKDRHFPVYMRFPNDKAWPVVRIIEEAWRFAPAECLTLIESNWLWDAEKDLLTWEAFSESTFWESRSIDDVCKVARRVKLHDHNLMRLVTNVSAHAATLAPEVVAAAFDGELARLEAIPDPTPPQPDAAASETDNIVAKLMFEPDSRFRDLLERRDGLYDLVAVAEAAPEEFIDSIWSWFVRSLAHVLRPTHEILLQFRETMSPALDSADEDYERRYPILAALHLSIVQMAATNPDWFVEFFGRNEAIDAKPCQVLLCRGLTNLAATKPDVCLKFLVEDPRRLIIGNHHDYHLYSRELIAATCPYLSDEQLQALQAAILNWPMYNTAREKDEPSTEFQRKKWERERRLRLLKTLPFDRLTATQRAFIVSEEIALPEYRDQDHATMRGLGRMESPMSTDQMAAAGDSNILKLFDELVDKTEWHHPRNWLKGGAIEASRALAELARRDPARCIALIRQMRPEDQQIPVAEVLRVLPSTSCETDVLFELIRNLDMKGFLSSDFRESAASAMHARISETTRLPSDLFNLLRDWLPLLSVDNVGSESGGAHHEKNDGVRSILWQAHTGITVPHGTYPLLQALSSTASVCRRFVCAFVSTSCGGIA